MVRVDKFDPTTTSTSRISPIGEISWKPGMSYSEEDYEDSSSHLKQIASRLSRPQLRAQHDTSTRDIKLAYEIDSASLPTTKYPLYFWAKDRSLLRTLRAINTLNRDISNGLLPGASIHPSTLELAEEFVERLFQLIAINPSNLKWASPTVLTDGEGAVAFEWWRDRKALTFFVNSSGEIEYLKAWGPQIWSEMEDDTVVSNNMIIELWSWLNKQEADGRDY